MDLDDLRVFVEVVAAGGVSSGSRRLGLPKSVVSRRLARLEGGLGVQLLTRTTKGAVLTESGASFRDYAMRVVAEMDAAQEALAPNGEVRGVLRIAAPLSFGPTQLAPLFAEFARRCPLLSLDTCYSDHFVDLVGQGFDCAIRLGLLPDSSLIARRICTFQVKLVASPHYIATHGMPNTLGELERHFAVTKKGEVWPLKDQGKTVVVRPRARFFADNGEAILAATLAGIGIAALPDFLIDPHLVSGRLVTVLSMYAPSGAGMFVVRPPGAYPNRKVRVLTEFLMEHFG